jgi:hypothetical protein
LDRTSSLAPDDQRQVLGTVLADLRRTDYGKINGLLLSCGREVRAD